MRPRALAPLTRLFVPVVLAAGTVAFVSGCGGYDEGNSKFTISLTSEYNGYFADLTGDLNRDQDDDQNRLSIDGGYRHFNLYLYRGTLAKGQKYDLSNSSAAEAIYDEGSGKRWYAVSGTAEVKEEYGAQLRVVLYDLQFEPDGNTPDATGTFTGSGTLRQP